MIKDIYIFDNTHVTFQTISENQGDILDKKKMYKLLIFKLKKTTTVISKVQILLRKNESMIVLLTSILFKSHNRHALFWMRESEN